MTYPVFLGQRRHDAWRSLTAANTSAGVVAITSGDAHRPATSVTDEFPRAEKTELKNTDLACPLAKNRVWLTDAYYAGTTAYAQGPGAAGDGVDMSLPSPNGTDIPLLRPLSRAGATANCWKRACAS